MKKQLIIPLIPVLAFSALAILFWQALGKDPQSLPSALIGKAIPKFALSELYDEQKLVTPATLPKEPFLLNVWATWCPSCQVEHPTLNQLSKEGVLLVGLNYKDVRSAAKQYLKLQGNPYQTVIFDEQGALGLDLGVYGAPETFLIGETGHIVERFAGVLTAQAWQTHLLPLYQAALESSSLAEHGAHDD